MNDPRNVLECRAVSKLYGQRAVLDRLDLTIPAGSVVGLLGKNGAGKTTLLRCALGLAQPQHGSIRLLGENPWTLSTSAKECLGYVPQTPQHYPWMRVRHLIEYTASFYRRWNGLLVRRLTNEWQIPLEQRAGTLSVGEAQKLALVLALGHEPDLLILDEPVASLDPAARRNFLKLVLDIAAGGDRSILFSTHITSDLERVADHVAILQSGRISFYGELGELKDQIKRLRLTSANTFPERFDLPGILHQRVEGNQALVTARSVTPDLIERIETAWHAQVEIQDLNLEEIFLELHHE